MNMMENSLLSLRRNFLAMFFIIVFPTVTRGWYVPSNEIQSRITITSCQMTGVVISGIESTPNPSSFLIRISKPLVGLEDMEGSFKGKTFPSGSFIDNNKFPEVASILDVDGVVSVFAMATSLTINKKSSAKWEVVLPLVMKAIGNDDQNQDQDVLLQGLLSLTTTSSSAADSQKVSASSAGQVRIRMQFSNKIPIQLEGIGYLGTVQRIKLPPKFQEYMGLLMQGESGNSKVDFFGGRKWVDRGIRYLPDDHDSLKVDVSLEEQERLQLDIVLKAEINEIDDAYSIIRLEGIVANENVQDAFNQENQSNVTGAEMSKSTSQLLDLESVDRFCDLAELGDTRALKVLASFVTNRQGLLPARRNALAYLGGTGDMSTSDIATAKKELVFSAVVSALQHEKSPAMRRTAGDALSDLGDPRAIPYAITAMEEDRSKIVQWRAARILGELGDAPDTVAVLKQASFSSKYTFEIAFEIKDALRKVQSRVQAQQQNDFENVPRNGPIWKQIQEGAASSSSMKDNKSD